jgi:CheY-like chemotaxis protein
MIPTLIMSVKTKNTILVVDDEPDILNLTEKFLKLGDFNTIRCSTEKEALRVIEERYSDISMILLDPMMPGLNTEKFIQSIKSDDRYKHILVVLFSAKQLPADKKLKADGYITKPFSGKDDNKKGGDIPFPYIRKPPSPPGDLGLAGEPHAKVPIIKHVLDDEPYCKHCGAELPKGQTICHVCGKKVL